MRSWVWVAAAGLALAAGQAEVGAQSTAAVTEPDASVGMALRSLASRAAVVFAGQVIAIQRHGGMVEIVFRVDTPVVGQAGATYTLREWAGLWPPGQWRYTVGERAMVFLHGSSQAGLSSAVDGGEGIVPVVGGADGTRLLDIRRLSTRVLRQVGQPLPDGDSGAMNLADAVRLVATWRTAPPREPSRHPLPPSVPLLPRLASGPTKKLPETRIQLSPMQAGAVQFVLQRGDDAAQ